MVDQAFFYRKMMKELEAVVREVCFTVKNHARLDTRERKVRLKVAGFGFGAEEGAGAILLFVDGTGIGTQQGSDGAAERLLVEERGWKVLPCGFSSDRFNSAGRKAAFGKNVDQPEERIRKQAVGQEIGIGKQMLPHFTLEEKVIFFFEKDRHLIVSLIVDIEEAIRDKLHDRWFFEFVKIGKKARPDL